MSRVLLFWGEGLPTVRSRLNSGVLATMWLCPPPPPGPSVESPLGLAGLGASGGQTPVDRRTQGANAEFSTRRAGIRRRRRRPALTRSTRDPAGRRPSDRGRGAERPPPCVRSRPPPPPPRSRRAAVAARRGGHVRRRCDDRELAARRAAARRTAARGGLIKRSSP